MTSSLRGWFETRPLSSPSSPIPPRPTNVVAAALACDGTAELRIVHRPSGRFSFEVVAWTNFVDAGGNPHHRWHTFHPEVTLVTDSFKVVLEAALEDARARMLPIGPMSRVGDEPGN